MLKTVTHGMLPRQTSDQRQRRFAPLRPALAASLACAVVICAADRVWAQTLAGDTVNVTFNFPDQGTVFTNGGNQAVAPTANYTFFTTQNISVAPTFVQFQTNEVVSYQGAAFNGYVITDITAARIVNATIDPTTNYPGFNASRLSFTANSVALNFQGLGSNAIGQFVLIDLFFADPSLKLTTNLLGLSLTTNQIGAALGLTNAFNSTSLGTTAAPNGVAGAIVQALNNTPAGQIPAVLDSLTGEGITGAQNVAHRSSAMVTSSITDALLFGTPANSIVVPTGPAPLAYAPSLRTPIVTRDPTPPLYAWRAWASGFGGRDSIRANPVLGTASQGNSVYGGLVGVDYTFAPGMLSGVAVGGTDGSFSVGSRQTYGSVTGGHAAFYSLANFGPIYAASINSVSIFGNRTTRTIAGFGGLLGEVERGNFSSTEFRTKAEFGYRIGIAPFTTLTPFLGVEAAQLRSNGFSEAPVAGAGLFALRINGQTSASVPMFAGARLQSSFAIAPGMTLTPTVQAAFLHEAAPVRNQLGFLVNLPGAAFLTDGARPARNNAQVKAGAELAIYDNVKLSANFDGEFSNRATSVAGKGAIKVVW